MQSKGLSRVLSNTTVQKHKFFSAQLSLWRVLKKLGIKPLYDPIIPLLGIYPGENKIERETCVPLFIAALFTIARTWKQPRCPSTDEWIKKL